MIVRLSTAGTALLSLVLIAPVDSPTNKFEAQSSFTKSFREVGEFQLDTLTQTINGQEVSLGDPTMEGTLERSFKIVDEYQKVEKGALEARQRSFEEIEGKSLITVVMMDMEESHSAALSSPLEGEEVLCTWDDEEEAWGFSFAEGSDGRLAWLEGLSADAEFQMIPPEDKVEQGESWTIDLAEQRSFFAPGGLLNWEAEIDTDSSFQLMEPQHVIAISLIALSDTSQEIGGELEVTWVATREIDGESIAELTLELEAELNADLTEELARMSSAASLPEKDSVFSCFWNVEGEGKMLWNIDRGHFQSLAMEFDNEIEFKLAWAEDFGSIAVEAEVSGTTTWEADAE